MSKKRSCFVGLLFLGSFAFAEPAIKLKTYYALQTDASATVSETNTCKNDSVFKEWEKSLKLETLPQTGQFDYWLQYKWISCTEKAGRVYYSGWLKYKSFSEVGNKVLEEYVTKINSESDHGAVIQEPVQTMQHYGVYLFDENYADSAFVDFFRYTAPMEEWIDAKIISDELENNLADQEKTMALANFVTTHGRNQKQIQQALAVAPITYYIRLVAVPLYELIDSWGHAYFISDDNGYFFTEDDAYLSFECKEKESCIKVPNPDDEEEKKSKLLHNLLKK